MLADHMRSRLANGTGYFFHTSGWLRRLPIHLFFRASEIRIRPASVLGPVLRPPCIRQRFLPTTRLALQGSPVRVLAPQSFAAFLQLVFLSKLMIFVIPHDALARGRA